MSEKRNSSRRQFLKAATVAPAALIPTVFAAESSPWQPTELGREFLRRLPVLAEAMYCDCTCIDSRRHPEYDPVRVAAIDEQLNAAEEYVGEITGAIVHRGYTTPAHLVDQAIMMNAFDEERPDSWLGRWNSRPELLYGAILALAGIDPTRCTLDYHYRQVEARITAAA